MSVQFEWQVGFDDDKETLARIGRRQRRKWPWWGWTILAVLVMALALGGYLVVQRRYQDAQERLKFQIQAVVDLEARAYAQNDQSLFLEQQDRGASDWFRAQATRTRQHCETKDSIGTLFLPDEHAYRPLTETCRPVLPATVDRVNLQGDIAWVEVIEDDPPVRRVRFYRQTNLGWKHTAPRVEFWGVPVQLTYGDLVYRYHRRDQPHVDVLIEHFSAAFADECATLGCDADRLPEIDFAVPDTLSSRPRSATRTLVLPSPWILGIPVDGQWDRETLVVLTYAAAYDVASQSLQSRTDHGLNRMQAALIDEYAVWQATGDTARAPIVGRFVERYGTQGLSEIISSLAHNDTLNHVLAEWLGLSANKEPIAYFQTLLDLEREALRAGRRRTFLLLQDDTASWWMSRREELFQLVQADALSLPPATVQTVGISADVARVTLETPSPAPTEKTPQEQTVFFRRRDGDWKHTAPIQGQADQTQVAAVLHVSQVSAYWVPSTTVHPPYTREKSP